PNNRLKTLVDHIKTTIGNQHFGNLDTVFGLVIFQDARQDPGQCQRATVQGVCQLTLPGLVLVAELEAIGLEGLEIGNGTDLQPTGLTGVKDVKIVGEGRGKAQIAAT